MSVLSRHAGRARALLKQLVEGGFKTATSRESLGVHHHSLNLLLRTGLAELVEGGARVTLKATDAGRKEVASWP